MQAGCCYHLQADLDLLNLLTTTVRNWLAGLCLGPEWVCPLVGCRPCLAPHGRGLVVRVCGLGAEAAQPKPVIEPWCGLPWRADLRVGNVMEVERHTVDKRELSGKHALQSMNLSDRAASGLDVDPGADGNNGGGVSDSAAERWGHMHAVSVLTSRLRLPCTRSRWEVRPFFYIVQYGYGEGVCPTEHQ